MYEVKPYWILVEALSDRMPGNCAHRLWVCHRSDYKVGKVQSGTDEEGVSWSGGRMGECHTSPGIWAGVSYVPTHRAK